MSKYGFGFALLTILALVLAAPNVSKADALSENFNELSTSLNATNLGAFTLVSGSVDVIGGALFGSYCAAPESGNCLDLDGSVGPSAPGGSISSGMLTLTPGTYTLSFDLVGTVPGLTTSTTVSLGSFYNQTFVLPGGDTTDGIVSTSFTVNSTTMVPLIFTSNTPGTGGALLDNVDLVQTPEPASLSLLALGLFGIVGLKRKALGAR